MPLAAFNSAAFTATAGLAIAANATIEVRRMSDSALAAIFSDEDGTVPITNPSAFADSEGRFTFYAAGIIGGYSIKVTKGSETWTVYNVAIGTAAQFDATAYAATALAATDAANARSIAGFPDVDAADDLFVGSAADTIAILSNGANALNKAISGLTYANNGTDATNDIDIFSGACMDDADSSVITLAATITKRLDAAWAVGTNQGGLDTGAVGDNDYYIWAIKRSDTGVCDVLFSLSATAPTMPTNYDKKRLIGWFKRVSSVNVAFTTYETEGGGIELQWTAPTLDIFVSNTLGTSRRLDVVKVPLDFSVIAHLRILCSDETDNFYRICNPDEADASVTSSDANFASTLSEEAVGDQRIRTDSSGQVAARALVASVDTYSAKTLGFTWARRN